jgi:hypothetical protein
MGLRFLMSVLIVFLLCSCTEESNTFYVSPTGSDHNSGTKDNPFLSLNQAREAVSQLIEEGVENEEINVYFRGGIYFFEKSVVFNSDEFGSGNNTIVFSAYQDEKPVFSGGMLLEGWKKADYEIPFLPEPAKGKIWVVDVPANIKNPDVRFLGTDSLSLVNAVSESMTTAEDENIEIPKDDFMGANYEEPEKYSSFIFPENSFRDWNNINDIEVIAGPHYGWVSNILPLKSVDFKTNTAYTTIPATYYIARLSGSGDDANPNLQVLNAIDYLDEPGEWVLNSMERKIYYWPLENEPGNVYYPLTKEIIRLEGNEKDGKIIKNIVFRGFTFAHGDRDTMEDGDIGLQHDWAFFNKSDALVRFVDAENCIIDNCTFTASGGGGVRFDLYSQNNKLINSKLSYLGGIPVVLAGYGPGYEDVNRNNEIFNTEIHDFGQSYYHAPGIYLWQSGGNRIAHNLIYNTPYSGIVVSGPRPQFFNTEWMGKRREITGTINRDGIDIDGIETWDRESGHITDWDKMFPYLFSSGNVIEYNEIHHVMQRLDDGNAIYFSGTGYNNSIRNNYLHRNISPHRQTAVRADDYARDITISDNIIYKFSRAGITAKYDCYITNNYIIDYVPTEMVNGEKHNPLSFIRIAAWGPLKGGIIKNNICYQTAGESMPFLSLGLYQNLLASLDELPKLSDFEIDHNLYYATGTLHSNREQLETYRSQGVDENSIIADPQFVGLEEAGFKLHENSPAFKLGIKQIDFESIGLIKNEIWANDEF